MEKVTIRENSIDFLKVCATILIVFHHHEQIFNAGVGVFFGGLLDCGVCGVLVF